MRSSLLVVLLLFVGCAIKPPKSNTPSPSLVGAKHGVTDAKDMLTRAQLSNSDISKLIKELESLRK